MYVGSIDENEQKKRMGELKFTLLVSSVFGIIF